MSGCAFWNASIDFCMVAEMNHDHTVTSLARADWAVITSKPAPVSSAATFSLTFMGLPFSPLVWRCSRCELPRHPAGTVATLASAAGDRPQALAQGSAGQSESLQELLRMTGLAEPILDADAVDQVG